MGGSYHKWRQRRRALGGAGLELSFGHSPWSRSLARLATCALPLLTLTCQHAQPVRVGMSTVFHWFLHARSSKPEAIYMLVKTMGPGSCGPGPGECVSPFGVLGTSLGLSMGEYAVPANLYIFLYPP